MIESFRNEYYFLSNFYPSDVVMSNVRYPTVEHAFQAAKAVDERGKNWILNASTPKEAQNRGRVVACREDWNNARLFIMRGLVFLKFTTHYDLRKRLIATGNEELIEGNWWGDTYWGVCNKVGENHLGIILMEARKLLK